MREDVSRLDRIALAIVRCRAWTILFWLKRPLDHIGMLRMCDALNYAPVTWKRVFLMHDPRGASGGDPWIDPESTSDKL